jgi:hypothetical protein
VQAETEVLAVMLTVKQALALEVMQDVKVVAGDRGLDRQIRHRNTMRGRLQRVQSLLSRSLDDPSLRRDLAVIKEIEHLLASEARPAVHHA